MLILSPGNSTSPPLLPLEVSIFLPVVYVPEVTGYLSRLLPLSRYSAQQSQLSDVSETSFSCAFPEVPSQSTFFCPFLNRASF